MTTAQETRDQVAAGMAKPISQAWAYRLVAMWCDKRAADTSERKLIKRARTAYKAGPLVGPVNRYADLLEQQTAANAAQWRALGDEMRAAAEAEDNHNTLSP